jgi:serine/threonine-protein kinase
MAPEQIHGEEVDRRADVFSLGVLLYFMTTAQHPFRGKNDMATLHNIVSPDEPTYPSKLVEGYPEALEQVVLMSLNKDREKRFSSTAAMARALEAAVPDVNKVGDAEVASFMRTLLAERLESRMTSLRKAIADAEQRESLAPQTVSYRPVRSPATLQGIGPTPPSSEQTPVEGAAAESDAMMPETSMAAGFKPEKRKISAVWLLLAGALGALVLLVALVVVGVVMWGPNLPASWTWLSPKPQATTTIDDGLQPPSPPTDEKVNQPTDEGSQGISVDSLPTAKDPISPGPKRVSKDTATSKSKDEEPGTVPTTPPPSTTPTSTSAKPPVVPGTVPKIRDPGF